MESLAETLTHALEGRYRIEAEIGRGGMATVYRAQDLRHHRPVALKVLHPELGAVLGVERFLAEIRVTANLQHPNLLPLFDSGEANGLLFYVMPLVEGESLRVRLDRERQLPVAEAVRMIAAILDGLAVAHAQGVIHRDLKPENILLLHGQPVVADFGIALAVSKAGGQRITQTGLSLGTPQYMSPEQASGDRMIDGRSDIYSAAVILFEMLAGEPPHNGSTMQALIAQVLTEKARDIRTFRDTVPVHVAMTLERALSKVPADRFDSAAEFARLLREPGATTIVVATTATAKSRKVWWPLATAVALIAAAAAWIVPHDGSATSGSMQLRRQLTFEGNLRGAAISRDGAWLAYVTTDCGTQVNACNAELKLREVDGTQSVTLLAWPSVVPDMKWTVDGASIIFRGQSASADSTGVFVVSRLGGATKRVHGEVAAFGVTPDGKSLYIVEGVAGHQQFTQIEYPSLRVGQSVQLPTGWSVHDIAMQPNGSLVSVAFDGAESGGIALLDQGGKVVDTWVGGTSRGGARWSSDGTRILIMTYGAGMADDLIELPVTGNRLAPAQHIVLGQLTTGLLGLFDVGATRSIVIKGEFQMKMLVRKLDSPDTSWRDAARWTSYLSASDISSDGSRVLATATDNLGDNLYSFDIDTRAPHQEFSAAGVRQFARWSPDGKRLLYARMLNGEQEIVINSAAGGGERVLRKSVSQPYWLTDSTVMIAGVAAWIEIDTAGRELARMPIPDSLSGELVNSNLLLTIAVEKQSGRVAYWSSRARAIVVASMRTGTFRVLEQAVHEQSPVAWSDDGALYFAEQQQDGKRSVSRMMKRVLTADSATLVTVLPDGCRIPVLGARGTRVVCRLGTPVVDVWLVERTAK